MDKTFLVRQLGTKLRAVAEQTLRVADEVRVEAKTGASRAVNLAKGTAIRSEAALAAIDSLERFTPKPLAKGQPIGLGAVVEIENDSGGRTLFIAPAGAGEEISGPDGDGFFHVVTPASPLGRALVGKRVGDVVETMINGEITEWNVTFVF